MNLDWPLDHWLLLGSPNLLHPGVTQLLLSFWSTFFDIHHTWLIIVRSVFLKVSGIVEAIEILVTLFCGELGTLLLLGDLLSLLLMLFRENLLTFLLSGVLL